MLNYLKKFAVEIVPSVAATVIGAYIVNHYISAKPAAEPPAAAVSTVQPKSGAPEAGKTDAGKTEAKAIPEIEIAGIPASGVKAKGISEKALLERNAAADKAVVPEKPAEKSADKPVDKPAETTASLPPETKRPAAVRSAKASPVTAAAPAEASASEDRRDANDLARAAIERLRGHGETPPRMQPAPRVPEVARAPEEPRVVVAPPSAVHPLPPPIMVATPSEVADSAALRADPSRPTPPAEIPLARPPLDLRTEAMAEPPKQKTNVAEDVLLAAKSMFHAVLPK